MFHCCSFVVHGGRDGGRGGGHGGGHDGSLLDDCCVIVRGSWFVVRCCSWFMVAVVSSSLDNRYVIVRGSSLFIVHHCRSSSSLQISLFVVLSL